MQKNRKNCKFLSDEELNNLSTKRLFLHYKRIRDYYFQKTSPGKFVPNEIDNISEDELFNYKNKLKSLLDKREHVKIDESSTEQLTT